MTSNRKADEDGDEPIPRMFGPQNMFLDQKLATSHHFYLSGRIGPPEMYTQWFEVIRNASPYDMVVIHINSVGGDAFTAIQLMRVMAESKATIVASVEGACMSAATFVFLRADQFEISDHSMFMIHNYSSMSIGKGAEMFDQITHERQWSDAMMRDIYKDFLSETEISGMLDNRDIWLSGTQVAERLKQRLEKRVATSEQIEKQVVEAAKASLIDLPKEKKVAKKPAKKAVKRTR